MPPRTYTQMNTRLGVALKEAGDASLARAGCTPSQAVRALWAFAAANADDPALVERTIDSLRAGNDPDAEADVSERLSVLHAGWAMLDEAFPLKARMAHSGDLHMLPDDSKLYEEALLERLEERGLS